MKKFLNVVKFFATSELFLFALMGAIVMGAVAVYAISILSADGYDLTIAFNAVVFSFASLLFLVTGIRETFLSFKHEESMKYYAHINNMVNSGEWDRI